MAPLGDDGSAAAPADHIDDKPMPLLEHLVELRTRLLWSAVAFFAAFVVSYIYSKPIFLFSGSAAGAHPGFEGRAAAADLYRAVRGVLHQHQGIVFRRGVSQFPGRFDPGVEIRGARALSQRENALSCRS